MKDATELVDRFKALRDDAAALNTALHEKQSFLDKKVVDLNHEIEFSKPDACTMVHIFKDLQDTFQQRRTLKNEIEVVCGVIALMGKKTSKLELLALGEVDKKYKVRVMTELDFTSPTSLYASRRKLIKTQKEVDI